MKKKLKPLKNDIRPLREIKIEYVLRALIECEWHQGLASEKLKISVRTIRNIICEAEKLNYEVFRFDVHGNRKMKVDGVWKILK